MAGACADPVLPSPISAHTLQACTSLPLLKQAHAQILKFPGRSPHLSLTTKLVSSYGRLGDLDSAILAFERWSAGRDAFLFNSLIQAHIFNSLHRSALQVYIRMLEEGIAPNKFTFPPLLKACSYAFMVSPGTQLHGYAVKLGLGPDVFIAAGLVDMYMKNGFAGHARKVFDGMTERDAVSWCALLTGYSQNGLPDYALGVYNSMREAGVDVDFVAVASAVTACSQLRCIHQGKFIHSWVVKSGFEADTVVATSLLDMYASWGDLDLAFQVFEGMVLRDLIAWNCLIACCTQNYKINDAFQLFVAMQQSGLKPNGSSMAGILPAVASFGALHLGKACHGFIMRNGLELDEFVLTGLMDVYAKSGEMDVARQLFNTMKNKSVVAWSSMITGYGTHGHGNEALALFEKMLAHDIKPNYITYVGVLSACAHAGLVDKGRMYFHRMVHGHRIHPCVQHYACMVDLLARAGLLDEAMNLINSMPIEPSAGIWGALLGGCRVHNHVDLGKYAADRLFELNSSDPGFYVLLSNIYAAAGMWAEVRKVRSWMRERGLRKAAGWSSIEISNKMHSFISGDISHPESVQIYKKLEEVMEAIGKVGYVPVIKAALHDVEDDVKENVLKHHSEKLAIAYGLLRTSAGQTIRIMKNLRTCEDCHAAAKFISMVTRREIVLRDALRFHHMKNGLCTCKDYW